MRVRVGRWPYPYRFAFGITDDTDQSNAARVRAVYDFCLSLGIRPTHCAWVRHPENRCGLVHDAMPEAGSVLQDPEYAAVCRELIERGAEVGSHGVSSGNNPREAVREGLCEHAEILGQSPRLICFHKHNAENLYWGEEFTSSRFIRWAVRRLVPTSHERYEGHNESSSYFCGDLMRARFDYTRLFRTVSLNVLSKNPSMPFHLDDKPYVKHWFSCVAQDLRACRRITAKSMDKLAHEDGLLLLYAHMAEKFVDDDGEIHPEVRRAFSLISSREDCWKEQVSTILDRLLGIKNLIVTPRRSGCVLSNPTQIVLRDVQVRCDRPVIVIQGGRVLRPDINGVFVIPEIPACSAVALYPSEQALAAGDPRGISGLELLRMKLEEVRRLVLFRGDYRNSELREKGFVEPATRIKAGGTDEGA